MARAGALAADGSKVVFDWKSDVDPDNEARSAYRQQLGQYLLATGSKRGAIVYMSTGHIDWITPHLSV